MLRRKLISIYIKQILIVGIVLFGLAITISIWMFNKYDHIEVKQGFAPYGIMKFIDKAEIDNDGRIISSQLLEELKLDGGWIQSIDEQGNVIQSFYTPDDVPTHYYPAQLIDYWLGQSPFPYKLMMWIQKKDNHTITLLYGKKTQSKQMINTVIEEANIINGTIDLPHQLSEQLLRKKSWIQVINTDGIEVAAWNKPEDAENNYTLQDLALRNKDYLHNGMAVESYFEESNKYSWILQYPVESSLHPFSIFPALQPELELMLVSAIVFLVASIIILIVLALIYANKFMKPIMDIILSIEQLGHGNFMKPIIKKKRNKKNKKLFAEVFDSIEAVDKRINESKEIEKQTHVKRDEWIAGITHDMKTPLSSIKGYAHMLAADQYTWTEDDIKKFASIMLEKTEYMNQLLDDLALTYRLSNQQLPVKLTLHNIAAVLFDAVQLTKNSQYFIDASITLKILTDDDIFAYIHPPWLERIVFNLVANAIIHNPEHTEVIITLEQFDQGSWTITFTDNGNGMDEQTMVRLFDRYYRGTNTEEHTAGSGLGMAITKQLVHAMNGSINVSSKLGIGTSIVLSWDKSMN